MTAWPWAGAPAAASGIGHARRSAAPGQRPRADSRRQPLPLDPGGPRVRACQVAPGGTLLAPAQLCLQPLPHSKPEVRGGGVGPALHHQWVHAPWRVRLHAL